MTTFCPVCGYDLALPDPDVLVENCPSCAFHFEEFDEQKPYSHFRADPGNIFVSVRRTTWAEAHLPWRSRTIPRPENWDPIQQLKNIGLDWGNSYDEWMEKNPVIIPENKEKFLKIAREHIQRLTWQPEFIEAIWDGDTQGWFLNVWVSAKRADGGYDKAYLLGLRGSGGDFRLFAGTVPPYPESVIGLFVLEEIAKEHGIPSYFPSIPPDDSYAYFWQRDESKRCQSCGKYLNDSRAQCWTCRERDEQAKKSP